MGKLIIADEDLIRRAEQRATGATVHDVNCHIGRYRSLCETGASPVRISWYRDVLSIFANGLAPTIAAADKIRYERMKAARLTEPKK